MARSGAIDQSTIMKVSLARESEDGNRARALTAVALQRDTLRYRTPPGSTRRGERRTLV
jgi:hypothetical protein